VRPVGHSGLQTPIFSASGAHVLMYAPLRFSKTGIFGSL
jgi:hypothetical protein